MSPLHGLTLGDVLREHRRTRSGADRRRSTATSASPTPSSTSGSTGSRTRCSPTACSAGDRIVWLGQNSFRLLECLLAAAKLGAFFCPVNWRQSADEMTFVLDDLAPAVVVHQTEEIGETVRAARVAVGGRRRRALDPARQRRVRGVRRVRRAGRARRRADPGDAVLLMYTAAFSGRPNAAMLSHTALIGQGLMIGRLAEIDGAYVYLNCGPLFHIGTFFHTLATYVHGGTNVFTPRVDAEELCRLIEAERCTGAFLMGPTSAQIRELNAERPVRPQVAARVSGRTRLERDDHRRHVALGDLPRRLRPDRGGRHAHVRRARRRARSACTGARRR